MAIIGVLEDGKKLVSVAVTLSNSGTAAADVSSTVTVNELERITDLIGVVRKDANNSGVYVSISDPNKLSVTAQSVPAGSSTTVEIVVAGY